jgi:hypothetical protein
MICLEAKDFGRAPETTQGIPQHTGIMLGAAAKWRSDDFFMDS